MKLVDSHTGGEPTRVIIEGGPDLGAGSLEDRTRVFAEKFDHVRTSVILEPRGSDAMVGALLCEPTDPRCATGVIFFNKTGYLGMCGHGAIGVAVTLAVFLAPGRLAQIEHDHEWEAYAEELDFHECGEDLVCHAASLQTSDRWQEHVKDHLDDPDPAVREHLARLLGEVGSPEGLALLAAIVPTEPDPLLRLELAGILVDAGHHGGLETIVGLLADDVPPLVRDDAHRLLLDESGSDFGYDPMVDAATNEGPIRLWREWVASGG